MRRYGRRLFFFSIRRIASCRVSPAKKSSSSGRTGASAVGGGEACSFLVPGPLLPISTRSSTSSRLALMGVTPAAARCIASSKGEASGSAASFFGEAPGAAEGSASSSLASDGTDSCFGAGLAAAGASTVSSAGSGAPVTTAATVCARRSSERVRSTDCLPYFRACPASSASPKRTSAAPFCSIFSKCRSSMSPEKPEMRLCTKVKSQGEEAI